MYIYGNSLQFTCMLISLCKCWEAVPPCTRLNTKSASYTLNFTLPVEHTHTHTHTHSSHIAIPILKCDYSYIVTIST